jgi:5-(aminomethyl)-3-furanmethanol phosphate kinase
MSGKLTVVKIGGSLASIPDALDRVSDAVSRAGRASSIVVVPGGGPFADAVRAFGRTYPLSDDSAHWMALLAMDQYAHVLQERIPDSILVDGPGAIGTWDGPTVGILAPYRWMRAADVLPHAWDATSDSVAAFVAGALDAARIVLIKPTRGGIELADGCFRSVLPEGMPCSFLYWRDVDDLTDLLSGKSGSPVTLPPAPSAS